MKNLRKDSTIKTQQVPAAPISASIAPIRVGFLVFKGFQPIDISGPWQAFATANDELPQPLYELSTWGVAPVASTSDGGLRLQVDHALDEVSAPTLHTVIVPGGEGIHSAASHAPTVGWLRLQDRHTQRTCSVCTGAFLLAAAGLLDDRQVTTHWRSADQLRRSFVRLQVTDEQIYCESGKYWTTAGVTAGIDLALTLIERDGGAALAQKVARRLVVYLRRGGDQRQYSQTLRAQDRAGTPFRGLIESIEADMAAAWSVDDMAEASGMSRRSFQRKFKAAFGLSPLEVLKSLRAERTAMLSHAGRWSRKEIERQVGVLPDNF